MIKLVIVPALGRTVCTMVLFQLSMSPLAVVVDVFVEVVKSCWCCWLSCMRSGQCAVIVEAFVICWCLFFACFVVVDVADFLACARAGLQLFSASSIPNFPLFAPIILSTQTDGLYIGSTTIIIMLRMRSVFTSGIYLNFNVCHLWNVGNDCDLDRKFLV